MSSDFRNKLHQECRRISEDSLYCAQVHYTMAAKAKRMVRWLIIAPASSAAILSLLSVIPKASEYSTCISALAALLAALAAISSGLGYDLAVSNHRTSGNLFTALRHEARSLCEVFCETMNDEKYIDHIRLLRERYNAYVASTEMTDYESYTHVRNIVKTGAFEYDSDKETTVAPGVNK